ncbi:hypothetical protein cyc_04380 [Cyclospora cayetanensis]|uniref:Uncharacterized protein n=1 Tax=Cyclospora cayetanensis TaxID=88456 RepID=A0A1D3CSK8_9EIME|nr:hypothetical protein cyc_04380 [Cyclospora cayetanensis]
MSAFASPAETDRFPIRSSTFAEAPVRAEMEAHVLMNPLLRGGVTQAPYASAYQQDTQSQMQQHRRSITSGPPYPFAATLAPSLAVPVGVPLGREGSAEGVGASSPGEKLDVLGEASAQFAKAAIRLLWGGLRSDELHLHLDSPARGPFLGVGPWGRRVGGPLCTKAMYEENGNAFVVSDPQEWLPLPNCFSRLLCTCGAAENTGGSSGSVSCCCTEAPPCGFISELNSVWVGGEGFLYLWEVGSPEDAVEQLSVPGSVESVVYIHLDREVLPPALRASFCWDDADLAAFSVTAHLAPSGCTDSPPFSSINASPLHCIAVSLTSSVRLFAISARAGAPRRNLISHLQHGRGGPPRSSQAAPASVCCCGMEFTEIGVADKPMRGFSGGPLELSHAVAHKGSSHVFFGSTSSQQVFRLEVGPRAGPPGGPRWGPPGSLAKKRAKSADFRPPLTGAAAEREEEEPAALHAVAPAGAVEAQGFRLWSRRTEGDDGLVTCRLAALNPKLSDWLRSSIALGVRRFFGLARSDSSVSAFLLPTLSAEQLASKEEDRNRYTTLRMTSKAIEEGLRSLGASWQRSPPAGCGGLLGPLLRTGGFVAVSLSVIPPQEGHSLAAVIVDASGGRTFLSLADPYSSSAPGSGAFPPPRNYAVRRPSAGPRGPPLRLVVGGYRGPIDPLPPSLGPLRCAAVASSVFLSAHAAKKEAGGACEEAAAPQAEEDRGAPLLLPRCGPCRNSCFVGAPCVLCAAFGNAGEGGPAGGLSGGLLDVQEPELPFIYEQSNGGSSASAAGSLCCCCKARPAIAEDAASPKCTAANNGSSDVLVAAAPDLRGLAMLQQGGCYSNNGGVAPGVTPASPLASNFFPSKTHLPTAQDPLRSQSSGRPPSLSNEWFCCFRLREGAGRVLLLCEPLPSPAFGVLQQCSSVFPSPFDSRKRQQWLSLPYGGDPFSSAEWEKRGLGGGPQRGLNGMSSKASICASLPAVCAPSALTDAAAGVLCGAPKLLVITSKYVLQVRRQTIAQIYVRSIENLMRGGPRLAALDDPRGIAMFAAFWQLMTDSASALAAFHATQASSSGRQQGGGSEGGPPNTTNLLDKQRGALRLSRAGAYFQPPSAPQLMQGGISGGPLGFFETPFGLGYVQDSGRQQQQEQQQTWGGRIFGYSDQKQLPQPQPPNQQQEGFSQTIGDPFLQPLPGSTSASSIPAVQSLPAGLSNTARGLILYASRLLRPILGTPLVEAALLPCGLARADPRSAHPQQQQQLGRLREEDEGTRKRGRGEFDWQPEELEDAVHRRHLCACLVGRFSAEAVDRLLSKIACLYEYGISKVLITAHEMLTAYQLLMQQAEYSVQMGCSRFVQPLLFDRLLSLSLTDLCMSVEARENFRQIVFETAAFGNPLLSRLCTGALFTREELEAQMLYLQLQRKLTERVHSEAAPTLPEVQNFVFYHLMPRLLFLPLEGLVSLLDSLKFYPLLVDVVTAKAAELTANFRLLTARRRAKWPSLNADSTHQNLADLQNLLISSCYRHVGECLSYHCKKLKEAEQEAPPADHQPHEQEDGKSHIDTSVQQESKACAAALVNACLGCSDENMQAYVLDWIATHGGKHFPIAMLQLDGPMADRLLAQSNAAAFATDLGECYAASGLYAQAAKCHSLQGLRHWSASEGRSRVFQEVSQAHAQQQLKADDSGKGANSMDASAVLVFDEHTDAFCCSLTRPVWQFLFSWLREHAQKPSLDERLLHFVKAKESAQNLLQKASGLSGQAGYGFPDKPVMGHFGEKSSLRVAKESNIALDAGADGLSSASTERSLRQIDLNIRMVGIQRALLRDAAHLFCFTTLSCMQNHKRERALITGQPQASVEAVSAADAEAFCCRISGGFGSSMSEHADRSQEPDSRTDGCRAILVLMIDLQREVYAPAELLELLTAHMKDSGLAESLTSHFPSIAALRLYGQRVAAAAAKHLAWSQEQDAALAALDEACMAFLSFAEAASRALHQPRIVSDAVSSDDAHEYASRSVAVLSILSGKGFAYGKRFFLSSSLFLANTFRVFFPCVAQLRDLLALPDAPVRDSCSRSLKRLCVVLHLHAQSQWGDRDVGMLNAEGEIVHIPGFLWPAWRLAECGQSFPALIDLYLSFEQDESAKHHSRLHALNLQTIFCWIFEQWLTSQDDVACSGTYVGLLHELKEAGDLPYFGPPVSVPLWSQLNEQERARADTAAQRLTDMLLQIELAMSAATRANPNLKSERHFIGVHSRLAILKQQVAEYRAALHKHARQERLPMSF